MVTITKRIVVLLFVTALVDSAQAAPAYPLKVSSANSRLLVDQNNIPFLLVGDSPHSLIVNLNVADAALFFRDRATNEFNSLWIELLCEDSEAGRADGSLLDGTTPFTNTLAGGDWDFTTPNEAYFAHVDQIVRMAETNGLQIMLNPLDTGGWLEIALANGPARCRQYGQYVGNRYKDFPNILWLNGNDFLTWSTPADEAVVTAIALGIKDYDTNHIQTVELDYPVSGSLEDPNWAPIITLNAAYTYYPTYAQVLTEYQRTNRMPVFMVEGHYEFQNSWGDPTTPSVLRRQEYWSLLSGAIGHCYGNSATWRFLPGWNSPTNLNSIAITEMRYVTALFKSREWHGFVPDIAHTVLTAGLGTYATTGTISGNNYATCARETNGHTVMVYAPTQRTMTINMTKVSGTNAAAWWFNPLTGTATNFGAYATTGTRTFTPPNNNDWVLVLDDTAQNFPAPGAAALNPNTPPTISAIAYQTISVNGTTGPLNFTVGDAETAEANLTLNKSSSNPTLVPAGNIVFGGSDSNRTVNVTPASGQSGTATITVTVSDGQSSSSNAFALTVSSQPPGTRSFTNPAAITIPDSGPAIPYPSTINVSGLSGTISNVTVTLINLNHTWPADVEILLVGPDGQSMIVMSDAGKKYSPSSATITLSDLAFNSLPLSNSITTGTYKPTDYPPSDIFPSPAPTGLHATNMAAFNGQSANGPWSLYVFDDVAGDQGAIAAGWTLTITPVAPIETPPRIISMTFGVAGEKQVTVSGEVGFTYALEASSDLANWTQVDVQDNTTGTMLFSEPVTTNEMRFFRAVSVPQ